jgi:hypothetical protein|tara:strand:+ start:799 stop:1038 length:240 start_codon:yes stop_codon:yes gene_type:complete
MEDHKMITISRILNDAKVFDRYANAIGIKLNNDSPIFQEIEGFIIDKIDEMVKEDVANGKYEPSYDDETLLTDLEGALA